MALSREAFGRRAGRSGMSVVISSGGRAIPGKVAERNQFVFPRKRVGDHGVEIVMLRHPSELAPDPSDVGNHCDDVPGAALSVSYGEILPTQLANASEYLKDGVSASVPAI